MKLLRVNGWLLAAFSIKLLSQAWIYHSGFIALSADEFSRAIMASHWLKWPVWIALMPRIWLPIELYLNAGAIWLTGDVIVGPRITVTIASLGAIYFLQRLLKRCGANDRVAGITAVLLALQPWFAWAGATPVPETYFLCLFLAALTCYVDWLRFGSPWKFAGVIVLLFLSGGFHLHTWTVLASFSALLATAWISELVRPTKVLGGDSRFRGNAILTPFVLLYPILAVAQKLWNQGLHGIGAFGPNNDLVRDFRKGEGDIEPVGLFHYARITWEGWHWSFWVLAAVGAIWLWRSRGTRGSGTPPLIAIPALGAMILCAYTASGLVASPTTSAPGRYCLMIAPWMIPCAAVAVDLALKRWPRTATAGWVAWGTFLLSLSLSPPRAPGTSLDGVRAGKAIAALERRQGWAEGNSTYLVEAFQWSQMPVIAGYGNWDHQVLDRKVRTGTESDSLLDESETQVRSFLEARQVRFAALRTPGIRARWEKSGLFFPAGDFGEWRIYTIRISDAAHGRDR